MKKILLFSFFVTVGYFAGAQELSPDQNPDYKVSLAKYTLSATDFQTTNNTTVQSTFKAYDWTTAKAEHKAERRVYRQQSRLNNGYNNGYYNPCNGNNYPNYGLYYQPNLYHNYYWRRY